MLDSLQTKNLEDLSPVETDTIVTTNSPLPELDRCNLELLSAQLENYLMRHNILLSILNN